MVGWLVLAAVSAFSVSAPENSYHRELLALTRNMPDDVRTFIDRRAQCNHWNGEEPYDTVRSAQISAAESSLRCLAVEADEKVLRQRYDRNRDILKALDVSRDWTSG